MVAEGGDLCLEIKKRKIGIAENIFPNKGWTLRSWKPGSLPTRTSSGEADQVKGSQGYLPNHSAALQDSFSLPDVFRVFRVSHRRERTH